MAENTTTAPTTEKTNVIAPVKRTKLATLNVSRNEVSLPFTDHEILRGKKKGTGYLSAEVTKENLDTVIGWLGRETAASLLDAPLRMRSQGWYGEAVEEATDKATGQVDNEALTKCFTKLASDFSARGESIPTLKKEIDELTDEMVALDVSSDDPAVAIASIKRFKEISEKIKELQLSISLKRRKDDDEEENAGNGQK